MKRFHAFILVLISALLIVSCENASNEKSESPLPGGLKVLKSVSGGVAPQIYEYNYTEKINIPSSYNNETITIAGNLFVPVAKTDGEVFPVIIFINSWACEEHEYIAQAIKFAKKGYIVLGYSHRGWGLSGGQVSMGGPEDWADMSNVITWIQQNTPADMENIGVSGISLGGGGSLNALIHDPRVKTVAALSSYVDAARSMYSEETPRLIWGSMLAVTGALMANMHPDIYKVCKSSFTNTNIPWLKEWAGLRSPASYTDEVSAMNKPVYIAHNFGDYLFQPDVTIDFFNAIDVDHKRLDLNQGTHASGEGTGLAGLPNYVYSNVEKWFDYWLKGIDTGIIPDRNRSAEVTMEIKGTGERVSYHAADLQKYISGEILYTLPAKSVAFKTFYCGPRTLFKNGTMGSAPSGKSDVDSINSGLISGATAGAMMTPVMEQMKIPAITSIPLLNRIESIAYESENFSTARAIRGSGDIKLYMSLSRSKGQVIAYLYDVDKWGKGTFITHGFKTFWDAEANSIMEVSIPLVATAYNVPSGHHLALVIDTSDMMYGKPDLLPFSVSFHYGSSMNPVVRVPFEN